MDDFDFDPPSPSAPGPDSDRAEISANIWEEYVDAKKQASRWKAIEKELGDRIKKEAGDAEWGTVAGKLVVKLSRYVSTRFNTPRFKNDYPEMYHAYAEDKEYVRLIPAPRRIEE